MFVEMKKKTEKEKKNNNQSSNYKESLSKMNDNKNSFPKQIKIKIITKNCKKTEKINFLSLYFYKRELIRKL